MTPRRTPGERRRRPGAPLIAGLVVLLLLAGVSFAILHARGRSTGAAAAGRPPVLRLSSVPAGGSAGTQESGSGSDHYVLAGLLPSSRPAPAPAYRFGGTTIPADRVTALAHAIGMSGSPRRNESGWQLSGDHLVLTVQDAGGWPWVLGPDAVTTGNQVQCFRAPCPVLPGKTRTAPRGQAPPSPEVAKQVAAAALRALGLAADDLSVLAHPGLTEVLAPHPVDGAGAAGYDTTFTVGGDRKIYGGHGWLGEPQRSPAYPLVTAAEAFTRLQAQPRPELALCRQPAQGGRCALPPQVGVTGARLGLMMAGDSGGALLVPAWLFAVAGQVEPVAVIAVASRYLGAPAPAPSSGSAGGSGGYPAPRRS